MVGEEPTRHARGSSAGCRDVVGRRLKASERASITVAVESVDVQHQSSVVEDCEQFIRVESSFQLTTSRSVDKLCLQSPSLSLSTTQRATLIVLHVFIEQQTALRYVALRSGALLPFCHLQSQYHGPALANLAHHAATSDFSTNSLRRRCCCESTAHCNNSRDRIHRMKKLCLRSRLRPAPQLLTTW